MNDEFLEGKQGVDQSTLVDLKASCDYLIFIREMIGQKEEELKTYKEDERKYSQEVIPNILAECGLSSITLDDGTVISVKEDILVSLPKKDPVKRNHLLRWIIEHGGAGIIKRKISIEDPEKEVLTYLNDKEIPFDDYKDIHSSTLKAWFRSLLGVNKGSVQKVSLGEVPKEANLFVLKKTNIKEKR